MSIIVILIALFLDYKSNKATFIKDLFGGIFITTLLVLSSILFMVFFDLSLIYGIFYFGIEIIVVFVLKAFIQSHQQK